MNIDKLLNEKDSVIWGNPLSNELGQLAQGLRKSRSKKDIIRRTNKILFIPKNKVPQGVKFT